MPGHAGPLTRRPVCYMFTHSRKRVNLLIVWESGQEPLLAGREACQASGVIGRPAGLSVLGRPAGRSGQEKACRPQWSREGLQAAVVKRRPAGLSGQEKACRPQWSREGLQASVVKGRPAGLSSTREACRPLVALKEACRPLVALKEACRPLVVHKEACRPQWSIRRPAGLSGP